MVHTCTIDFSRRDLLDANWNKQHREQEALDDIYKS